MEVEAVVEVAMAITITVAMRQPMRLRCTTVNRHRIVMVVVAPLVIIRTVLLHTLLGRRHHINTGKGTDPGHTPRSPRTAGTLTRMAVGETHHGLVRTVGADITLGPRAEADTVEVAGEDIVVAVVGVVMVMEAAGEGLTTLRHIRAAATILVSTIADIRQAVEAHREGVVEVEVTELWLKIRLGHGHFYSYSFLPLLTCLCLCGPGFIRCAIRLETGIGFCPLHATCISECNQDDSHYASNFKSTDFISIPRLCNPKKKCSETFNTSVLNSPINMGHRGRHHAVRHN